MKNAIFEVLAKYGIDCSEKEALDKMVIVTDGGSNMAGCINVDGISNHITRLYCVDHKLSVIITSFFSNREKYPPSNFVTTMIFGVVDTCKQCITY